MSNRLIVHSPVIKTAFRLVTHRTEFKSTTKTQRLRLPLPSRAIESALLRILFLPCLLVVYACTPAVEQIELRGETMGTTYSVIMVGRDIDKEAIKGKIDETLNSIIDQMSTWQPDSEISRFNNMRTDQWFKVSNDFIQVMDAADRLSSLTAGAFDVTIGGLVELWGFEKGLTIAPPDHNSILDRLRHTGPTRVKVDLSRSAIRKTDPHTQINLSGIAKGYAVDTLAEILMSAGINNYLVEIGGEVRASGVRSDGKLWQVAIEQPDAKGQSIQVVIALNNAAIATSGDYRNFFELDGKRYSHIIDPATGGPPEHDLASVSVVASDTMTADALATGLMVMGKEKALALADRNGIATYIIERSGDSYKVFSSDEFKKLSPDDS